MSSVCSLVGTLLSVQTLLAVLYTAFDPRVPVSVVCGSCPQTLAFDMSLSKRRTKNSLQTLGALQSEQASRSKNKAGMMAWRKPLEKNPYHPAAIDLLAKVIGDVAARVTARVLVKTALAQSGQKKSSEKSSKKSSTLFLRK